MTARTSSFVMPTFNRCNMDRGIAGRTARYGTPTKTPNNAAKTIRGVHDLGFVIDVGSIEFLTGIKVESVVRRLTEMSGERTT